LLSDEELLQLSINSSDQEALGKLYTRYIPLVYGLCLKYLRQQEEAEDAVMHIYEEVSAKVMNYQIQNFKTWLYSVAKNYCLQLLRKSRPAFFEEISNLSVESEPFLHLLSEDENEEKEKALSYCIGTLPEEQNTCIRHFFLEDFSYAEIVNFTGYTLNQVKSFIQNGKRNLKNCMVKVLNL
jgi:RNA polymerase sigma-70 factor, ECF subfamily